MQKGMGQGLGAGTNIPEAKERALSEVQLGKYQMEMLNPLDSGQRRKLSWLHGTVLARVG